MDAKFRLIAHSDTSIKYNIALDEVLLCKSIQTQVPYIRLWENKQNSICLGISKHWRQEVFAQRCLRDAIPIVRRFSGGGTVWQQQSNINYTLVMPLSCFPKCSSLSTSYQYVLAWMNQVLNPLSLQLHLTGDSDFCFNNLKVSGNAQARRRKVILHHGTLINFSQIKMTEYYLKEPIIQPQYRSKKNSSSVFGRFAITRFFY